MLAARIPGILPPLSRAELLETTRIYSAMGLLPDGVALMDRRPVRTPHHSATAQERPKVTSTFLNAGVTINAYSGHVTECGRWGT